MFVDGSSWREELVRFHALVLCLCSDALSLGTRSVFFFVAILPAAVLPSCTVIACLFSSCECVWSIKLALQLNLRPGNLLRFAVRDESVKLVDGKMEIGDLQFVGKLNRARAFADSHSKVSGHKSMHYFKQCSILLFIMHLCFSFCTFRFCSSMLQGMFLSELRICLPPFSQTIWSLNLQMLKCKIEVRT